MSFDDYYNENFSKYMDINLDILSEVLDELESTGVRQKLFNKFKYAFYDIKTIIRAIEFNTPLDPENDLYNTSDDDDNKDDDDDDKDEDYE